MTAVEAHDYEHVAVLHDGPDDLARRVAGPLRNGLERGESVLVCLDAPTWQAVAARVGPIAARATVMPPAERYASPGTAMAELHRFVDGSLDAGAPSVWSIGTLPFEGDEHDDRWWRYESAVDAVLGDRPLHAICAYDRSTATPRQVAGACRTHAVVDAATGRQASPSFRLDADVEAGRPSPPWSPQLDLRPDTAASARHAVAAAVGASLDPGSLDDLVVMVSEMVANGLRHGRPPVTVRLWNAPDEVVVEVRDCGDGLDDVYADLRRPRGSAAGGFGLWLVGQLAHRVTIGRDADGSVVTAAVRR